MLHQNQARNEQPLENSSMQVGAYATPQDWVALKAQTHVPILPEDSASHQ